MKTAFIFPGQGSQYVGMGRALAEKYPEAREAFEQADEALGRPISELIFNGPAEELTNTWNTQPAIVTVSVACLKVLASVAPELKPDACAGHSLGEYAALVATGALEFADAVRLVEKRGKFMQEAVPVGEGAMYAVLGLDSQDVADICDVISSAGSVVEVANDNCPGQIVISGHAEAVERAGEKAKEAGARRAVPLAVSAPFHCSLMQPAADKLLAELEKIDFGAPTAPVVANVDCQPNSDPARIKELLYKQVFSPVRWTESVVKLSEMGMERYLEIGPGKVLSGLVKRGGVGGVTLNVENPETLEALVGGI